MRCLRPLTQRLSVSKSHCFRNLERSTLLEHKQRKRHIVYLLGLALDSGPLELSPQNPVFVPNGPSCRAAVWRAPMELQCLAFPKLSVVVWARSDSLVPLVTHQLARICPTCLLPVRHLARPCMGGCREWTSVFSILSGAGWDEHLPLRV